MFCTKEPFNSEKQAQINARSVAKKLKLPAMHVYKCDRCGKYHLTKISRKEMKERKKRNKKAPK